MCAIAEGTSFIRAYGQLRGEADRSHTHTLEHVKTSRDTTVKAALFEDTAAVIGSRGRRRPAAGADHRFPGL